MDTEEENVKLIARVFDERVQRDKSKKKPSSSDTRPPRSVDHRSPLAALAPFISTGLPLKQVLRTNGLLHLYRIHGIKRSYRRSSQRPIKSLSRCPNDGTSTHPPLSCFVPHSLTRCLKYRTQRYPRVLPGWKLSQPGLPIPLQCPLPQWWASTISSRRSFASYVILPQRTISTMTFHLWMISSKGPILWLSRLI